METLIKPRIRPLNPSMSRDLAQIREIEKYSFEFPWTDADFNRYVYQLSSFGAVAEVNDKIVGFVFYERSPGGVDIVNIAVWPDHRMKNIGTLLVQHVLDSCDGIIQAAVREANLPAQLFFKKLGFNCIRSLKQQYLPDSEEDQYIFRKMVKKVAT